MIKKRKFTSITLLSSSLLSMILAYQSSIYADEVPTSNLPTHVNSNEVDKNTLDEESTVANPSLDMPNYETVDTIVSTDVEIGKESDINEYSPSEGAENNLMNGSFQDIEAQRGAWTGESASDWHVWIDKKNSQGNYHIAVNKEGNLEMHSQEQLRAVVYQETVVDPTKTYLLSFDVKTQEKTGAARVRIIEGVGEKKNLWYSPSVSGSTDWTRVESEYQPISTAEKIKLELFYETGLGSVLFDNISLREQAPQVVENYNPVTYLPDEVRLSLDKRYVLPEGYHYVIENDVYAKSTNGLIVPLQVGATQLKVFEGDKEIKQISLILDSNDVDYYDGLLEDWNDIIAGNGYYDASDEQMKGLNAELEGKVAISLEVLQKWDGKTAPFEELSDYEKSSNITATYRRLEEIAKQITNPYSQYYQSPYAIRVVKNVLNWLDYNVYNHTKSIIGNWWDYEIGAPRAINNTLSLLRNYFAQSEIIHYTNVIEKFVPDPNYFRKTTAPFEALGGNLIDMGRVKLIAGLLRKDAKEIEATIESLNKAFQLVNEGEGFYQDGSYIAHTNVAYTGAYGSVLIDGLSQLLPLMQKIQPTIVDTALANVYHWIDESFLPLLIRGELMDMSRGRAISRKNSEAHVAAVEVIRGINRIAEISEQTRKHQLQAALKGVVLADTYYNVFDNLKTYRDISLMNQLLSNDKIKPVKRLSYIKTFNNMDKLASYNADKEFGLALSMYSKRTQNYEDMNNENRKGWYTGDGMVYLYNKDLSHYSDDYWATVNPYRLPGTTILEGHRELGSGQGVGKSAFVGSVSLDNHNASVAMDFTNWNNQLSLHKAWFILGNYVVFLGSPIQNNSNDLVVTTIEQRKVNPTNPYKVFVNQQEIDLSNQEQNFKETQTIFLESEDQTNNIAYYFFNPTTINIVSRKQEGTWRAINANQPDDVKFNDFITITQPHNSMLNNYAYVMMPNVSRVEFESMINRFPIQLLSNTSDYQAVHDNLHDVYGIVKYDNTPIEITDYLSISQKGLYTFRVADGKVNLTYLNPETQSQRRLSFPISYDRQMPMPGVIVYDKSSLSPFSEYFLGEESFENRMNFKEYKEQYSQQLDWIPRETVTLTKDSAHRNSPLSLPITGDTTSLTSLLSAIGLASLSGAFVYCKERKNYNF